MALYEHRKCGAFGAKPYSLFRPDSTLPLENFQNFESDMNDWYFPNIFAKAENDNV